VIAEVKGVTARFGSRTLFEGLSFGLAEGDLCSLVGRSGSGKTTLLLVLAGLLQPASGEVVRHVPDTAIAYVPQAPSLVPELTAAQNASLPLRVRGEDPAVALAEARNALSSVGLEDAWDALPAQLSRGMQQRVALARVLAAKPRFLLADEPTGTLDQDTGHHVVGVLLETCAALGTTLVVATHDDDLAARFPKRLELAA
jgi:predicted ABC-type transport system involved in lysophospholipase L1 biosynthesis ATPase subunit